MLDLDTATMISQAFDIVNQFWPLIAFLAALGIGFSLVKKLPTMFKDAI